MAAKVWKYQQWTALFLVVFGIIFFIAFQNPSFLSGNLFGIPTLMWGLLAILVPVVHHFYVWITWRMEIHHQFLTKRLGDRAFFVYEIGFFILFFGRIILIFFVALSNASTLNVQLIVRLIIIAIMAAPMGYTFYSVLRYFGMHRAAGADHFLPEYRNKPFVKKGIYKYTSNAMYKYAMLVVWIPGLLFGSVTALLIALFNHLYVWVHYFTLERPDFAIIYNKNKK